MTEQEKTVRDLNALLNEVEAANKRYDSQEMSIFIEWLMTRDWYMENIDEVNRFLYARYGVK